MKTSMSNITFSTLSSVAVRKETAGKSRKKITSLKKPASKKINSKTVLGPNLINAGVHPLNKNEMPSFWREDLRMVRGPEGEDYRQQERVSQCG